MKPASAQIAEQVESIALYLAATFFIVLGAINVVHNLLPLFQGAAGTWWPVLLGMVLFGLGPFLFGAWLVWRSPEVQSTSSKESDQSKAKPSP